jgi:putative endonuclease
MRTPAQQAGDEAEALVARRLRAQAWQIIGTQVRVGRAELDILAIDPGPPKCLVAVEVRWRRRRDFGLPEETVDHVKVRRLQRAILGLLEARALPDGRSLPWLPVRVDLVAVDRDRDGSLAMRHYRSVEA